jgi:hypothetical protein
VRARHLDGAALNKSRHLDDPTWHHHVPWPDFVF